MSSSACAIAGRPVLPLLLLLAAGCIDFVEPELPDRGAPAAIEATIRIMDDGTAELDARLVPGLDSNGNRRAVERDIVDVLGRAVAPDTVLFDGTRRYVETWAVSPQVVGEPISFEAPRLGGVVAMPPAIEWSSVRRVDPDTIQVERGEDVVLALAQGSPVSQAADIRQWFLRLEGDSSAFNISADGLPPDIIQVPARWIPAGAEIAVRLIQTQSAVVSHEPGDYLGLIVLDTRLHWTVRMLDASTGSRQ